MIWVEIIVLLFLAFVVFSLFTFIYTFFIYGDQFDIEKDFEEEENIKKYES